jgi:NDP-sugar pyrophosphorylase family protein
VVDFVEKPTVDYRVSMGVYGLSRRTLKRYTPGMPFGFDELVLDLLARNTPPHEYPFSGYWLDIGRPDDYDRANAEFDLIKANLLRGARCAS